VVNRGVSGENIAPVEIDGIMLSHKDVAEAVSFGVPDEMYGQEIHAAVVLKANAHVTEKELQKYIATKVAKFKVPKKVSTSSPSHSLLFGRRLIVGDLFYEGDSEDSDGEGSEGESFASIL
jgi:acyl-CoA synthetase (AMP-forming)/AMP-acid ligase II